MPLDDELELRETSLATDQAILDAIDAASDQDHTTWITNGGRRIAKIAPVDEIPDDILSRPGALREMTEDEITRIARDELDELLEFAGQIRAAMQATRLAYDALFGASGARLLRAGRPQSPLTQGQAVLFCWPSPGSDWEPGTFIRYDGSDAVLQDAGGHPVITTRSRVLPAAPADLGATLAAKRAETEPVWKAAVRDPLGPPWYGKRDEIGDRLAAGDLILVGRDHLRQVLQGAGLLTAFEVVWEALRPPVQPAASSGRPEPGEGVTATGQHHTGMASHGGFAAHSHEVRPDHLGVPRTESRDG